MAELTKVVGKEEIAKALRAANVTMGSAVRRGLKRAGLYLQRKSQEIVPVHKGNLKASAGTRATGTGWNTDVVVFYTAAYAVYVHERTDVAHGKEFNIKHADEIASAHTPAQRKVWFNRGENQQAKFLETPARTEKPMLLKIITGEAQTGMKQVGRAPK